MGNGVPTESWGALGILFDLSHFADGKPESEES